VVGVGVSDGVVDAVVAGGGIGVGVVGCAECDGGEVAVAALAAVAAAEDTEPVDGAIFVRVETEFRQIV